MSKNMAALRYKPIKTKLKLVIISTCILTLILVYAGFFTYEHFSFKKILINDLSTKAELIAENSNASLTFNDSSDAARVLKSLASQPHITSAAIYDSNGKIFATYTRPGEQVTFPAKPVSADKSIYGDKSIEVYKSITLDKTQIGTIYLSEDLSAQQQRFWSYLEIAFFVLLGSLLITYIVAAILAKNISTPIIELASTAKKITEENDFTVRAAKYSNDETGQLSDSFNLMLKQIQQRDESLRQTNKTLMEEIIERKRTQNVLLESEERKTAILQSALDAIISIDEKGCILEFNPSAEKMFGYKRSEVMGKEMAELIIPSEFREQHREGLKHYLNSGKGHILGRRIEMTAVRSDGSEFPVELSIARVETEEPIFTGFIRDITKNKELQVELKNHQEHLEELVAKRTQQLETANKELETFSYSVSHDLRAPLRAIDGFAGFLIEDYKNKLDEEGNRYLNIVKKNSVQMGQLIDDLLAFSRMSRVGMNYTKIDMEDLASETFKELMSIEKDRKIELHISDLPKCKADPSLIKQVWVNLIANAIKYTRSTLDVKIEIGGSENEKDYKYFIKDNGVGFDMKYADKLFGVFQRLHKPADFEGTGVGLALIKRIITRHGGTVNAEAKVNEGATFYFTIPKGVE
jgi:PAS domain S-box-containing protein